MSKGGAKSKVDKCLISGLLMLFHVQVCASIFSCTTDIGYYRDSSTTCSQTPCTNKPANSYYTGSSSVLLVSNCAWMCNTGYTDTGSSCVWQCPGGQSGNPCSNCPSGSYKMGFNANPCTTVTSCSAGYYKTTTTGCNAQTCVCPACTAGNYCLAGATSQTPCPAGSYCPDQTAASSCPAGNYCPAGSTSATACMAAVGPAAAGDAKTGAMICPA